MNTRVVLAFAPSLLGLFLLNCSDPDLCEGAQCAADGGANGDATVGDGSPSSDGDGGNQGDGYVPPVGCNTAMDVSPQAACVTESNGLFVNAAATKSGANGTKAAPYTTINDAVAAASTAKPNIFICAGMPYAEHVVIARGVNLYGGFSCSDWSYSTSNVPLVTPASAGYALELSNIAAAFFEDLEFDSQSGVAAAETSTSIFAAATTATFRRVRVTAGNSGPTPDAGAAGANYANGSAAPAGYDGDGGAPGQVQKCPKCENGDVSSAGPGGGSGSTGGTAGGSGLPTLAPLPTGTTPPHDGVFGTGATTLNGCQNGDPGAYSTSASGGSGAATYGVLSAIGWQPLTGGAGNTSSVAQGGGGGGGGVGTTENGSGGGGGCGGCGGGGGTGGAGGGSSFAVLSFNSSLTFDACLLTAALASGGGGGGDGQGGQPGGNPGVQSSPGCPGGTGGMGGTGGGGGGGAAGVSVDVGYVGGTPPVVMTNCTTTFSQQITAGGGPGANASSTTGTGRASSNAVTLDLSK